MRLFPPFLALILLLVTGIAMGQEAPLSPAGPKLVIDNFVYDFGEIRQGETREALFRFTNVGDQPLIIYRIDTTCDCTAVKTRYGKIPPGESGEIVVTLDSRGRKGDFDKPVTLRSNSVIDPNLKLTLKAHIVAELEAVPQTLTLARLAAGATASGTVTLFNRTARAVTVTGVSSSREGIVPKLTTTRIPPNGSITLAIDVQVPRDPGKRFSGRVHVATDLKDHPGLDVRVIAEVPGGRKRFPQNRHRLPGKAPHPRPR